MKVATPLVAARPPAWVPPTVLPVDEVTVITALLPVTTLPPESSTLTIGWVASEAPQGPPTGAVVMASLLAAPTASVKGFEAAAASEAGVKVSV